MLCQLLPLDRAKNSDGQRRSLEPADSPVPAPKASPGMAPLLQELMAGYAATGLPPAYVPKDDSTHPRKPEGRHDE